MKWQPGSENDNRIKRRDGWLDLPDIEAPCEPGVFVFVDDGLDVLYVGCAGDSLDREIKEAAARGKTAGASMYSWHATISSGDAATLSALWTERYRPVNCAG